MTIKVTSQELQSVQCAVPKQLQASVDASFFSLGKTVELLKTTAEVLTCVLTVSGRVIMIVQLRQFTEFLQYSFSVCNHCSTKTHLSQNDVSAVVRAVSCN